MASRHRFRPILQLRDHLHHRWHAYQDDTGGEEDAEGEADRHGYEELGLHALFQNHRQQGEEGGQRGQQDRSEAVPAGLHQRIISRHSLFAQGVVEAQEDERVVDHDPRQRHHAEHAHEGQVVAQ